jgi:2-haloacid dehalogenase
VNAPRVVVFDVNETLSDMSPLWQRFLEVGAPELTAKLWFASLLRDAFALTAAGSTARFRTSRGPLCPDAAHRASARP